MSSSRQLERRLDEDFAFRVLAVDQPLARDQLLTNGGPNPALQVNQTHCNA